MDYHPIKLIIFTCLFPLPFPQLDKKYIVLQLSTSFFLAEARMALYPPLPPGMSMSYILASSFWDRHMCRWTAGFLAPGGHTCDTLAHAHGFPAQVCRWYRYQASRCWHCATLHRCATGLFQLPNTWQWPLTHLHMCKTFKDVSTSEEGQGQINRDWNYK